ncbi:hypothetical protein BYT27DRAFT_7162124 [Phlegmacium glaucopus]|nr:hypothetical protein BYT27DRAFT_7162124 [Phlegmacium glaucopus]
MSLLSPLIQVFRYSLQPIAPFTWFGLGISTLDVVAAFRLCIALRQLRDSLCAKHLSSKSAGPAAENSFIKSLSATLIVVYGGEAVAAPFLGIPPSFMLSGLYPSLYAGVQAIVDILPAVPIPSAGTELPLSLVDGFTRAYLLCNLIPPTVTTNASTLLSSSPWALLVTSLLVANGGFFFTNLFSFFSPISLSVQTPPELQAYGWTTTDLWCAPFVTGLYALLTHAQPFWADVHGLLAGLLGASQNGQPVKPLDPEVARAVCALCLSTFFVGRTVKTFGLWKKPYVASEVKTKTQ